jgi:hypothetical protein
LGLKKLQRLQSIDRIGWEAAIAGLHLSITYANLLKDWHAEDNACSMPASPVLCLAGVLFRVGATESSTS